MANIIAFGTFGAKMVMRGVARVRDLPYAEADKLAKMVPDDLNISLDDAIEKSPEFKKEYENNPIAKQIVDTGRVIEGMVRNVGTLCSRCNNCGPPTQGIGPLDYAGRNPHNSIPQRPGRGVGPTENGLSRAQDPDGDL